eukprot:TRINITY_DN23470_c0_g1_i1.p1 TRINITY_DN23470_c0_g1~~TRINITY_DN23470_c0_g1_i1.p1  ORF type:complete len:424 (+),score=55.27 TRINITY_DN23470_c0_g1_i1:40-1272(+)
MVELLSANATSGLNVIPFVLSFGNSSEQVRWSEVSCAWRKVLQHDPEILTELRLNQTTVPKETLMKTAGQRLLHLDCSFVDDAFLATCAQVSPNLRQLHIAPSPDVTTLPTTWELRSLDVRGCAHASMLRNVQDMCASLRHLKIGWWREHDVDGRDSSVRQWIMNWVNCGVVVARITKRALQLKEFHMSGYAHPSTVASLALADLRELEILHIPYAICEPSMNTDATLTALPRLRDLNLRACSVDAPPLQNLIKLNMSCTFVTARCLLRTLGRCPELRVLDLCYPQNHQALDRSILPQLAELNLPLEMLGLGGFSLTDEDLALIVRVWRKLKNIGIGSAKTTNQGLRVLKNLPDLKRLCAHNLPALEETFVWELLGTLEEVDFDKCTWVEEPSDAVREAIAARPYNFDSS